MESYTILYNPLAGNGTGYKRAKHLKRLLKGSRLRFQDITKIVDYRDFFATLPASERIVICGGDGTLNRFVNYSRGAQLPNDIYCCPGGSGNDFMHDLGLPETDTLVCINPYLRHIPTVTIKGRSYWFLNGVGIGLDGYCCEEGERARGRSRRPINYTRIALEGLFFRYKPKNAVITVDGREHSFCNVWLTPTMNGRYFGGGMMPTPEQDRLNPEHTVSVMVVHNAGKLKVASVFPKIFTGAHTAFTRYITILTGHDITVRYDAPAPVQIDGEVIPGVTEYRVESR